MLTLEYYLSARELIDLNPGSERFFRYNKTISGKYGDSKTAPWCNFMVYSKVSVRGEKAEFV